ncbi:Ysc84 actin-binding domain protein [Niveomyces insectorum RCEF 264]|uniref:Ysc84 actin-binding domain protein n=1 Tax=Niveomyces insectorum RCEF 264 TaxID=1081102 RepID=A0A167ZXQ8_9HYPO|nr:Ysc84 actin-binding domain protein [Niveomyces insectorum RCEF 264]
MGSPKLSSFQRECNKAAKILKGFVDKGKIPVQVVANAKGLAVFTGFRAGMYFAGAGGSGIVLARLPDGTWSPPSAFSVRSGGFGLVYGVDVYDCVCVLNTPAAVDAYTKPEMSFAGAATLAAGPMGGTADLKDVKPVWTYTRSRGLYGGLTLDGTVINEKPDTNAEFYGCKITSAQILHGEIPAQGGASKWPADAQQLIEVLKMAEGKGADAEVLQEINAKSTPEN